MRTRRISAALPPLVLAGFVLVLAPVLSGEQPVGARELVDFRMAPLEQVKKISLQDQARNGAGETHTVMTWDGCGDGHHIILTGTRETPPPLVRARLSGRADSISWHQRGNRPMGSCDSDEECEEKTDSMCSAAGHGGVDADTVTITTHMDGSKTCSGDCQSDGAVAFVTCTPD